MKPLISKPKVLMILENAYPGDSRVRKEATALKELYDITVISLKRNYKNWHEMVDGVEVIRVPEVALPINGIRNRFIKFPVNVLNYALQYSFFTTISAGLFLLTYIRRRYKVIHAHNPPDTLFLVGLLGKLFSIKFVYDHHDLAPELYLSRYSGKKGIPYKILMLCEKLSCKLADVVIATNASYKEIEINRHRIYPEKIFIVRNDPIIREFSVGNDCESGAPQENNKRIILFVGSINPQDGVDVLIEALHHLVHVLGERNIICRIVGDGDSLETLKGRVKELDLHGFVEFTGYIYDREKIKEYLASADVCVEPAPYNELNKHSTFIKIMEYMASAKPIVAFDYLETRYSTNECALLVSPADNMEAFAMNIKRLIDDSNLRNELGRKGRERIFEELNWKRAASKLICAYESINTTHKG